MLHPGPHCITSRAAGVLHVLASFCPHAIHNTSWVVVQDKAATYASCGIFAHSRYQSMRTKPILLLAALADETFSLKSTTPAWQRPLVVTSPGSQPCMARLRPYNAISSFGRQHPRTEQWSLRPVPCEANACISLLSQGHDQLPHILTQPSIPTSKLLSKHSCRAARRLMAHLMIHTYRQHTHDLAPQTRSKVVSAISGAPTRKSRPRDE